MTASPAHAVPSPLRVDLAILEVLAGVLDEHRDLPELMSRHFSDSGLHATPYIPMRPVTSLAAWLDALPGDWTVAAAPSPAGGGTELVASGELAGFDVTFAVTTARDIPRGPVDLAGLHILAAAEPR